jgi:hypothetical protein
MCATICSVAPQRRQCSTAAMAAEATSSSSAGISSAASSSSASSTTDTSTAARDAARAAVIDAIMQRDKEIFTLKRQHELSMLRVEHNQNRTLKDQTDRGLYFEQNCNVHTFDTISVGLYSQRNTMYHTMMVQRLREVKIGITVAITAGIWSWLYYKYMWGDEWMYLEEPVHFLGATTHLVREAKARKEEDAERKQFMQRHATAAASVKD